MAVNRIVIKDPTFQRIKEGMDLDIDLTFLNGDIPEDPGHYFWRVDNLANGDALVPWTAETVAATTDTLNIPATVTEPGNIARAEERRQLVIAGPDEVVRAVKEFAVEMLVGVGKDNSFPAVP